MPDYNWMAEALCRDDPEVMFPHSRDKAGIRRAQAWCASCPVFKACEGYTARINPTDGVWAAQLRSGRPSRSEYQLKPCGTPAAYQRHYRNGETCVVCLQAKAWESRKAPTT